MTTTIFKDKVEEIILLLQGSGSRLSCQLQPPLKIPPNVTASITLTKLTFYNSFSNISEKHNNQLKIKPGDDSEWMIIQVPEGAYELDDLNSEIIHQLTDKGVSDVESNFRLEPNLATLRAMITLRGGYILNFNVDFSIAKLLGFKVTDILNSGKRHIGSELVNINSISSLILMTDVVSPSYHNGKLLSYIYNTVLNVAPGVKVVDIPVNLTYIPLINDVITSVNVWILDQNLKTVDFRGEDVEIEMKLRLEHRDLNVDESGNIKKTKLN